MRFIITLLLLLSVLFAPQSAAPAPSAPKLTVVLKAATHSPTVNVTWKYSVTIKDAKGQLVAAKLSIAVVDPVGGVHPVEFLKSKKTVTNYPVKGVFKDAIIWPPMSVGYPLKIRATAVVKGAKASTIYTVKVKGK